MMTRVVTGWIVFAAFALAIGLSSYAVAQNAAPCADAEKQLASAEQQLQVALDSEKKTPCLGEVNSECSQRVKELEAEITGLHGEILKGCPSPAPSSPPSEPSPVCVANPIVPPGSNEAVYCWTPRPNTIVWRIDRPNVNAKETAYPQIVFFPNDLVSVFAGGCVQTGGHGLTWKRYVEPVARNKSEDSQYYGLITLPGFGVLRPIKDAVLAGGIGLLQAGTLTLGYLDDHYPDNGYWGRDDGWWEQCRHLSDAFVVIVIQHGCASSAAASCIRGEALDKVVTNRDPNGFPVNPQFVWTALTNTAPKLGDLCSWSWKTAGFPRDGAELCTSNAIEKDINGNFCDALPSVEGRNSGHVNLPDEAVTYSGSMLLDSANSYEAAVSDDDLTFDVDSIDEITNPTPHEAVTNALVVADQNHIPQAEFSFGETNGRFQGEGGFNWWDRFLTALGSGTSSAKAYFNNSAPEGIIVGLLGFDCAHTCNSELHPVWAFFVHTKRSFDDDTWAFFVRNWGNEGYCGKENHILATTQLSFRLPQPGATSVSKLPTSEAHLGSAGGLVAANVPVILEHNGSAAIATVTLPQPGQSGVVYGELHLTWTVPLTAAWRQRILTNAKEQGIPAEEINAAEHSGTTQAFLDLESATRARASAEFFSTQHADDSIEGTISAALAAKSASFRSDLLARSAGLQSGHRPSVIPTPFTVTTTIARAGVPVRILTTKLPPGPDPKDLSAAIESLFPAESTDQHPELQDPR